MPHPINVISLFHLGIKT